MKNDNEQILRLEARIKNIESALRGLRIVQNPFWFGVVIADTSPCSDFTDGHTEGQAELFIADRAGSLKDLKASGLVQTFTVRFNESYSRGQLILFAQDWNDSVPIMPACTADFEDKLTVGTDGLPLSEEPPPPPP